MSTPVLLSMAVLAVVLGASLLVGAADLAPAAILAALTSPDGSSAHLIVRTVRVPRMVIGAAVGACLAVSGAIAQGLTRNPLAAPGILGINAGAALGIVAFGLVAGEGSASARLWAALLGGGAAAALIAGLAARGGGVGPLGLTIAGAALTALLASVTQGLLLLEERSLDEMRFWLAGSLADRDTALFLRVSPFIALGLAVSPALGRAMDALDLGDDVARGLGQRVGAVRAAGIALVVLLAGSAVAVAGPVAFVGLVAPHVTRRLVGTRARRALPLTALHGATLLVLADVAARRITAPDELPLGVMTALVGGPVFVAMASRTAERA